MTAETSAIRRWRGALIERLMNCKNEHYSLDPIERDLVVGLWQEARELEARVSALEGRQ